MYQKTIIVGFVGNEPELKYFQDGGSVCNFSVAVSNKWTGKDGTPHDETTWFRISANGKMAENCNQFLSKGSKVLVEGKLSCDPATGGPKTFTRKDGSVSASFELKADTVRFLSGKNESGNGDNTQASSQVATVSNEDDDIPF